MRYLVSLKNTLKYTFLYSILLLAGCATASNSNSSGINKTNSSGINKVDIVDQSVQMRPLSSLIMRGAYVFPSVESHEIEYRFNCDQLAYNLTFAIENSDDELSVSLIRFSANMKDVEASRLAVINEWLVPFETVGPVGLKCSSDKTDRGVSLIIRGARVNDDMRIYDFKNRSFTLQQGDFE